MGDKFSLNSLNAIRRDQSSASRLKLDSIDLSNGFAQIFEAAPATPPVPRERPQPKTDDSKSPSESAKAAANNRDDDEQPEPTGIAQAATTPRVQASDPLESAVDEPIPAEITVAQAETPSSTPTPGDEALSAEGLVSEDAAVTLEGAGDTETATEADAAFSNEADWTVAEAGSQELPSDTTTVADVVDESIDDVADVAAAAAASSKETADLPTATATEEPVVETELNSFTQASETDEATQEQQGPAIERVETEPELAETGGQTERGANDNESTDDATSPRIVGQTTAVVASEQTSSDSGGGESAAPDFQDELPATDAASFDLEPTVDAVPQELHATEPKATVHLNAAAVPAAAARQSESVSQTATTQLPDAGPSVGSTKSDATVNPTAEKAKTTEAGRLDQADRARLLQRVSRAFQQLGTDGGSLKIRLHPPRLGSMGIDVNVSGRKINARIVTESEAASQALRENLHDLKNRLAEQGFEIESIEISTDSEASAHQGSQQETHESFQRFAGPTRSLPDSVAKSEPVPDINRHSGSSTSQLDLVA
ncbi:Flagellar hook-length control protein FliK [Rosistilla carotiformis]|uniref:Flagellar hook-length control protein FliK n=1 Tax=Rosistilla carotiformis TaxID=2528017 RepID=A0A518JN12_9BACT|nr:flagellar hook-length control protein FliK [Rosistilla carotiformis]QDV66929.1 Flagellar hook-length control protein FliK [Rosistilla carotiformis]